MRRFGLALGVAQQAEVKSRSASQLPRSSFHLTKRQAEAIAKAAPSLRDEAIIRLLTVSGLRRAELVALCVGDIDLENGTMLIRKGKGNKLRVLPMPPEMLSMLKELGQTYADGPVFVSRNGSSLSLRQVNRIVANCAARAGVRHPDPSCQQIGCHLFRHSFARWWKEAGGDIETLSHLLGHESVKTTWDQYGTPSLADIRRTYCRIMRNH